MFRGVGSSKINPQPSPLDSLLEKDIQDKGLEDLKEPSEELVFFDPSACFSEICMVSDTAYIPASSSEIKVHLPSRSMLSSSATAISSSQGDKPGSKAEKADPIAQLCQRLEEAISKDEKTPLRQILLNFLAQEKKRE